MAMQGLMSLHEVRALHVLALQTVLENTPLRLWAAALILAVEPIVTSLDVGEANQDGPQANQIALMWNKQRFSCMGINQ